MASLDFYINTAGFDFDLDSAGSGLAFFGDSGFGNPVVVGAYQGTTYASDGNGLTQGAQAKNVKWANAGSGILGAAASGIGLTAIPNYQATVSPRFTHGSAVQTQNVELRVYDRSDVNTGATGVTSKAAEIIHPSETQGPTGSGDDQWVTPAGSAVVLNLAPSPGISGLWAGDGVVVVSTRTDTQHDWYVALSASPDSIGNKTAFGLYMALEYL
jgi:hypothetical protein